MMKKLFVMLSLLLLPAVTLAQGPQAPGPKAVWEIVIGAGMMVKFVLIVLVVFSVVSWAIIALKYMQVRVARKTNEKFMEVFWGGSSLEAIQRDTRAMKRSPIAQLFQAGYQEISKSKRKGGEKPTAVAAGAPIAHALGEMESVERALRRASSSEMGRLERYSSFLATTGSTAPFVGLFGTVWGIMNSFRHISTMGKVGMDVVAPGISEALIATAFGLAAAIPAVVAYNYFVAQTRGIANEMDSFTQDLLNIVQRYFL